MQRFHNESFSFRYLIVKRKRFFLKYSEISLYEVFDLVPKRKKCQLLAANFSCVTSKINNNEQKRQKPTNLITLKFAIVFDVLFFNH